METSASFEARSAPSPYATEHRVGDRRVERLIQKWLRAGVLEEGKRTQSETGTVQGGSISPLLANLYLHYVFDLWVRRWRRRQARGEVIVVRFADDFVVGFEHRQDAVQFRAELRDRFVRIVCRSTVKRPVRVFATSSREPRPYASLGCTLLSA